MREKYEKFDIFLKSCQVPNDFPYRPKTSHEIGIWKAADFKLFLFHLLPLIFACPDFKIEFNLDSRYIESVMKLCLVIRILSGVTVSEEKISFAENLIELFFENFVDLYGKEAQSYNFHSMRPLAEQVRRCGILNCSRSLVLFFVVFFFVNFS